METLFLAVLNMSLTASYIIPFVLVARLLLKKVPKIYSYCLWSVVLFRLLCPFSLESALSLLPEEAEPITRSTLIAQNPEISTGIPVIDQSINSSLPAAPPPETGNSINPLQIWTFLAQIFWVSGIIVMLLVASVSLVRLKKKLMVTKELEKGVFLADDITSPFVFGVISPKIYLPSTINEEEIPLILSHERFHLKRFDHVTRLLSFVALTLHWFNPLVWISYYLSEKDMETSCDEGVLREKSLGERGDYATALLKFTGRRTSLTPLAFSENDTKSRVKNIMKMKKTKFWVSGLAFILVLGLNVGFATTQKNTSKDLYLYTQVENLQPLEISTKVAQKVGVTPDELMVSPDSDIVRLTNNFESYGALPFSFFFQGNHQLESGRYYHYYDNRDEEITDQSIMESKPKESYSLNLYLEAIKYLPQEEILSMCKKNVSSFTVFITTFFDESGSDRHIYYSESGVQDSNNWSIPLMVQAYYPDGKNSQYGTGGDIIWVYYTPTSDFTEEESSDISTDGYVSTDKDDSDENDLITSNREAMWANPLIFSPEDISGELGLIIGGYDPTPEVMEDYSIRYARKADETYEIEEGAFTYHGKTYPYQVTATGLMEEGGWELVVYTSDPEISFSEIIMGGVGLSSSTYDYEYFQSRAVLIGSLDAGNI